MKEQVKRFHQHYRVTLIMVMTLIIEDTEENWRKNRIQIQDQKKY
jgi:hypothetical protein